VQPLSVLLCLLGYPPFLLTLARWRDIAGSQARLAAMGHQVAGWIVTAGWLLAGRWAIAGIHVAWLIVARIWFAQSAPSRPISR
jgi:hypothetical protein